MGRGSQGGRSVPGLMEPFARGPGPLGEAPEAQGSPPSGASSAGVGGLVL